MVGIGSLVGMGGRNGWKEWVVGTGGGYGW